MSSTEEDVQSPVTNGDSEPSSDEASKRAEAVAAVEAETQESDKTKSERIKKKAESEELTRQLQKLALERQKVSPIPIPNERQTR